MMLVACNRATDLPTDLATERPDGARPILAEGDAAFSADRLVERDVPAAVKPDTSVPLDSRALDGPALDGPAPDRPALDGPAVTLCGRLGELCCPGLECSDAESVCVGNDALTAVCEKCGRSSPSGRIPCCAGNQCLDGSCCVHVLSGNLGPVCAGIGASCWGVGSSCAANGSCGPTCGGPNQPCCQGLNLPYCSASGTACMRAPGAAASACLPCGKAGQPCCEQVPSSFSIEPCGPGLACTATPSGNRCGS
jgi:hypothetical protein